MTKGFSFLENTIKCLDSENKEVIVIGDLNCDYSPDKTKTHDFHKLTISEVFQFTQIIDKLTHITATSKSIIDLIYTNQLSRVVTHGVVDYGISDHCLVYVVRKVAVPSSNKHKYVTTRSFKKFKANKFAQELRNLPWGNIESLESPNEMWDVWKQLFLSVLSLSVSASLFASLSVSVCLSLPLCLSVPVCLSVSVSLSLSVCLSVSFCLSVCLSLSVCLCLSVSVCLSLSPPLSLSVSVCLSVCLSLSLSLSLHGTCQV